MTTDLRNKNSENMVIFLKYSKGERNFKNQKLSRLNLSGISLANIDLSEADLTCANLAGTDLTGANLTKCCLKGANLKGCNLSGAILHQADLSQTNLTNSNLHKVRGKKANFERSHLSFSYLKEAYLVEANFVGSSLNQSDLSCGNFQRANFSKGFLTGSNLTKANFQGAIFNNACLIKTKIGQTFFQEAQYNQQTLFDHHFCPENYGMTKGIQVSIVQIINSLNYLSQVGCRYLGSSMTVRYLQQSRPPYQWAKSFHITDKGLVHYEGKLTEMVNMAELKWYQQWVAKYINTCSMIIKQFGDLLEKDKIISSEDSTPMLERISIPVMANH